MKDPRLIVEAPESRRQQLGIVVLKPRVHITNGTSRDFRRLTIDPWIEDSPPRNHDEALPRRSLLKGMALDLHCFPAIQWVSDSDTTGVSERTVQQTAIPVTYIDSEGCPPACRFASTASAFWRAFLPSPRLADLLKSTSVALVSRSLITSARISMFSAEEIHNLVAQVLDLRRSHEWPPGGPDTDGVSHDDRTPVPSEVMATQHSKAQYWCLREPSIGSLSSDSTDMSGSDVMSVAFSDSTAPSIPEFEGDETAFPIPCEFRQYSNCYHTFNTISGFISHCVRHHRRPLPKTSICWHCDDWIFSAPKETPELQELYFLARLRHIGEHYLDELPGPVRPDHFVLTHLHTNRQINDSRFAELYINEDDRLVSLLKSHMESPSPEGRYDEQVGGAQGRARREARQGRRGSKKDRR